MNIQWFPGHMAKTRRMLKDNLKLVDVVVELIDARIPVSSRNPELDEILGTKPRIIVMNKEDLADQSITNYWKKYFKEKDIKVISINCLKGTGLKELKDQLIKSISSKIEKDKEKGRIFRSVRTMVVGVPNVGKSTLINKLSGGSGAVTGDRPGVTRNKQWIRVNKDIELLDTPGLLWPKFDDEVIASNLAFTGAIKDDILDVEELATKLIEKLLHKYKTNLEQRFKIQIKDETAYELLEVISKKRGCILSGGVIDTNRMSVILLDEFRGGKLGKISLDYEINQNEE